MHSNCNAISSLACSLRRALDKDRKAIDCIAEHCVENVLTLERIVDEVKSYSTAFNSWGSGR